MTTAVETQAPAVEVAPAPVESKKAAKPAKEEKPKEKKPKTAKTAAHPPYFQVLNSYATDWITSQLSLIQ